MKRHFRIFIIFLCGLLTSSLLYCAHFSPSRFEKYCDRFFREEMTSNALTLHYTVKDPETYGISCDQISLGSYDIDISAQKQWLLSKWLTLKTIARGALSKEQRLTYDLLSYTLETELDGIDFYLFTEPLVPSTGIQSQLPILLAEYAFYKEADVINYLTLLSCVPEYFDSLLSFEKTRCSEGLFMDRESADALISYCDEFLSQTEDHFLVQTFRERLSGLALSPEQNARYIKEHDELLNSCVFPAYKALKTFLMEHKDEARYENGLYDMPGGTDYYAWLLRSEVGTDRTFEEIETVLETALKEDASIIAALLKKTPDLLEQQNTLSLDAFSPSGLTAYLSRRIARDFPATENVSVKICDVPSSMEPHLSPAFYLVPPIDDCNNHVVYLNNSSLTNDLSFFTTLAHESYPGHLYQTVFENSTKPHPVHRLLYFGGYIEGWATYAEQLSFYYAPISTDLASLLSCSRAMTLNLYSHLDLYIHAHGWTEEDCAAYLKKFGITGSGSVHEIYLLVKQQPANYLKYYLGYLEICELKKQAENVLGETFDLKEFHKFLLDYGPAPFTLLEKELENQLRNSQ